MDEKKIIDTELTLGKTNECLEGNEAKTEHPFGNKERHFNNDEEKAAHRECRKAYRNKKLKDYLTDMEEDRYYTLIRYKCKHCGFTLERRYKSPEAYGGGMVTCTCGSFNWDPHPLWPRVSWMNGADPHKDLEEYFETAPVGS